MDGDVITGVLGADVEWERALAGVVISHSAGDGGFQGDGAIAGNVQSTLTGVYPYARLDLTASVSAWAMAGAGSGDLTLTPTQGGPVETDVSMRMGALGLKGRVLDPEQSGGLGVNIRADAMWVGTKTERTVEIVATEADATRLRLIVEGERHFALAGGSTVTPSGEIGLRHDSGDAETGTGVELGAGLRYAAGPLSIEGRVRGLVAHEEDGYREWGASGAVRLDPGQSGRGLSLSIAPVWGAADSQAERLWSARDARDLDASRAFDAEGRVEAEAGYGIALPNARGLLTPYAGLTLAGEGSRTLRTGARWDIAPDAALGVEGQRSGGDEVGPAPPSNLILTRHARAGSRQRSLPRVPLHKGARRRDGRHARGVSRGSRPTHMPGSSNDLHLHRRGTAPSASVLARPARGSRHVRRLHDGCRRALHLRDQARPGGGIATAHPHRLREFGRPE